MVRKTEDALGYNLEGDLSWGIKGNKTVGKSSRT